jgi:tRNA(Ile)-lysidine synthase
VRYDWFAGLARAVRAAWVGTGHTADDQAETVLFRLLRGAGLHGLSGMRERRPLGSGVELVRPLLSCRRSDVLAFLSANQQDFRQDASNLDRGFTRNRLRLELMPDLIAKYNLDLIPSLCHLAEQAREVQAVVEETTRRILADVELPRAGDTIVLQAGLLASAPRHLQREVFRLLWTREGWAQGDMTFEHWDRLSDIVAGTPSVQDFPQGIIVRRTHGVIQVGRT